MLDVEGLGQVFGGPLGEQAVQVIDQLPFKSQNRYSAVRIRDGGTERVLVLGACEALKPFLEANDGAWERVWKELLQTGLRLLLFAEATRVQPFGPTLDGFTLRPLLLVGLSDELTPGTCRRAATDSRIGPSPRSIGPTSTPITSAPTRNATAAPAHRGVSPRGRT